MSLPFTLTYSLSGSYTMRGGPLKKTFNRTEWANLIKSQPIKTQGFYLGWAEEAQSQVGTPITRILK